ncbi:Disease resistance protein [Artemisia annua]|uniref:Disease resistance protein n=1 Tax=Artemisia annua TaxID=35608 RepID=A0A2U1KG26_ARTAN|nr:Disease resistance protein [Artemisia annua]
MADSLTSLINQSLDHLNDFSTYNPSSVEALDCKRLIAGSFDGLMSHLRKMMLGYENEEAHGLVKIIETICVEERQEIAVGFDEEVETLLDQLTGTSAKQLQIISIVRTPGLGKTTLARYPYNHPLIEYTFDIRAWTCVSQVYIKRNLLLDILSSFSTVGTDEIYKMSDELLGEKFYRFLKDRQYLVVLDDIWDRNVWNELKIYFPDDNRGSRVIFTSRHKDVRKNVGGAKPAHVLRLRNEDESWEIFQKKVFRTGICPHRLEIIGRVWTGICPHRLEIIGREIANKCGGLPLAIVITSGLLKNKCYNLLPRELQQRFLFLGVFPEDYDIPVTKMTWLWVAQGFIHETGSKSLEDVAEDFWMNLIQRSLLTTAKIRVDGQIKACRIQDLLRDLCLRKAEEEHFSSHIYSYARAPAAALPSHSGFCYPFELGKVLQEGGSMLVKHTEPLGFSIWSLFLSPCFLQM